jgi:hypothetical protein
MKIPTIGWAFFALAVVVLAGYVLNRGLYVGSTIDGRFINGNASYRQRCHYLYLNGVRDESGFWMEDRELTNFFCPPLHSN